MEKNYLINIIIFALLLSPVLATDFTPRGDINMRGLYEMKNATNVTAQYFIGDGSLLTSVTASVVNWSDITSKPTNLSQFTDDLGDRGYTSLSNFTNNLDLINSSYANATYILQSEEGNLNVNSSTSTTIWASVSSFISKWFYDDSNVLTFNETQLNTSVNDLIDVAEPNLNVNYSTSSGSATTWDDETSQANLNVNSSNYWDSLNTPADIDAGDITDDGTYITSASEGDLNVNRSNYWDSLNTPSDINAAEITDDGTYILSANEGSLDVNSSTFWASVSSFISKWFYDNGDVLTFNETQLNSSIDDRIDSTTTLDSTNIASLNWTKLQNYPAAPPANTAITELGDTITTSYFVNSDDSKYLSISNNVISFSETELNTTIISTASIYNDSAAIALKLDITDQRYNDTVAIGLVDSRVDTVNATAVAKASPGSCPSGQVVMNTTTSGVQCVTMSVGGSGNPFDQSLNTTDNVAFQNITMGERLQSKYPNTYLYYHPSLERIYQYIAGKQVYYSTSTAVQLNGGSDDLDVQINGNGRAKLLIADAGTRDIIINEDSANDINFRVEGDTDANLLFTDPVNSRIGIGTSSPQQKLEVAGGIRMNTAAGKPTCDANARGTMWSEQNTTDKLYWCAINSTSDYNWVLVALGE